MTEADDEVQRGGGGGPAKSRNFVEGKEVDPALDSD